MAFRRVGDYTHCMSTMIGRLSRLVLAMFLFVLGSSVSHAGTPIEGRWHTPKQEGTVEVTIANGVLTGTLVESTNPEAKLGMVILRGFVRNGETWEGEIYLPKRDKTMDAELTLKDGRLEIEVSSGLRSKSITWTRAKSLHTTQSGC